MRSMPYPVQLGLDPQTPPVFLYHGTVTTFIESIQAQGLISGARQYVHLSSDVETAAAVGSRRGKPIVLLIQAQKLAAQGQAFYQSQNGVWLTDQVPVEFIWFPDPCAKE